MSITKGKRYYTYELIDPRCGSVFYVGKGQNKRISEHVRQVRSGRLTANADKCSRINSILQDGCQVIERIHTRFTSEYDAYEHERRLISYHGFDNLTNAVDENGVQHRAVRESEWYPRVDDYLTEIEFLNALLDFVSEMTPKTECREIWESCIGGIKNEITKIELGGTL